VFFNGTFLRMLLLHISFYIFKVIIFQNIEVLGFEIFKNLKVKGSLVPMYQLYFPVGAWEWEAVALLITDGNRLNKCR
jgi:hypothetical protein